MTSAIPRLLKQLWRSKVGTGATGAVTYAPAATRSQRELQEAYRQVRRLLIVRLDAIGDAFLFLDSLRKLRALFPEAHITVLSYSETKPVYERSPHINQTIFLERDALASNKGYRENCLRDLQNVPHRWDLVLNPLFSRELLAEEIVRAIPAPIKLGVAGDYSNIAQEVRALTDPCYSALLPVDSTIVRHELHRHNEILSLLGSADDAITLEAPVTAAERQFAAHLTRSLELNRYGVVFPGTKGGTASIKYWGSDNYASLIDHLRLESGWEVMMLLGGRGEEQIASEITALTRSKPCVFQGDLSLWQAAAVLEQAAFYVGSDTSVAHVAAALKVPVFVLLGGGHYGRFFPYPEGSSVTCVTHKLDCYHCYWKCRRPYNKCIADIPVAEVVAAMDEKLAAPRPPAPPPSGAPAAPASSFHIASARGGLPKIDLVLPPGLQAWHLREAWAMTLEKAGCLNRVFRPTVRTADTLLRYLRSGGKADLILAIGGDHHLSFLHDTEEKREAWQCYRGQRVCNSFESTRDSPYKIYVQRVRSALQAFTHFLYSDEVDARVFEAAGRPALWWPQVSDTRLFSMRKDLAQRKPRAFFCGKMWDEYPLRKALLQALRSAQLCDVAEGVATGELAELYNQYLMAINLPGVLGGFNMRTYEAMACGCLLFQFLPAHRPANNALFEHRTHLLYYDYTDVAKLKAMIQQAVSDPGAFLAVAQRGHEEVLAHHTIERRLAQMLDWIYDGRAPNYPQHGHVPAETLQQARQRRYVNDPYLFEGRPCWNGDALNEFADLQFLHYHAIFPRLCGKGETLAWTGETFEASRLFQRALDMDSETDLAHNNLGVLSWKRGDHRKAYAHFEAALAENPRCRPAIINYGEALALAGRGGEARAAYAAYLREVADDAGVRALLERAP